MTALVKRNNKITNKRNGVNTDNNYYLVDSNYNVIKKSRHYDRLVELMENTPNLGILSELDYQVATGQVSHEDAFNVRFPKTKSAPVERVGGIRINGASRNGVLASDGWDDLSDNQLQHKYSQLGNDFKRYLFNIDSPEMQDLITIERLLRQRGLPPFTNQKRHNKRNGVNTMENNQLAIRNGIENESNILDAVENAEDALGVEFNAVVMTSLQPAEVQDAIAEYCSHNDGLSDETTVVMDVADEYADSIELDYNDMGDDWELEDSQLPYDGRYNSIEDASLEPLDDGESRNGIVSRFLNRRRYGNAKRRELRHRQAAGRDSELAKGYEELTRHNGAMMKKYVIAVSPKNSQTGETTIHLEVYANTETRAKQQAKNVTANAGKNINHYRYINVPHLARNGADTAEHRAGRSRNGVKKLGKRELTKLLATALPFNSFRLEEKWLDSYLIIIYKHSFDSMEDAKQAVHSLGFSLVNIGVGYDYNRNAYTYYLQQSI